MKEQFLNIFNAVTPAGKLKFNRRVSAILVCFSIALIFWLLIALSRDYSTVLQIPVVYKNLPGQKVVVNDLPSTIALNVKTSGFRILSYNFKKARIPVEINVSDRIGNSFNQAGDVLVIPTRTFASDFLKEYGDDISIVSYVPDSIVFNFSAKFTRRIPVKLNMNINFEKQYDSIGTLTIRPDSIDISGPGSVTGKTNYINTEQINLDRVKDPVSKKIKLLSDNLLTLSDTIILVTIPVEKFTEENLEIPVRAIHVQNGYSLKTFPDKITVRYQVALSRYRQVSASLFDAVVDASKAEDQKRSKMNVKLITVPPFVKAVTIEPERVDYILRKQ